MRFIAESTADGVTERLFTVEGIDGTPDDAAGAVWAPAGAAGPRPLVLIGHGGAGHSTHPSVLARARRYVTGSGYAVAALDLPGWGGRPTPPEYEPFDAEITELTAAGKPLGDAYARRGAVAAELAVPEWRAALGWLAGGDWIGPDSPVGYWGASLLGTSVGLPLAVAEPKIAAAVLGLAGHGTLAEDAARVRIPVEFLLQWDDEVVPRESGLALFGALGSAEKTLHANPGGRAGVPAFETASSERFFARHLSPAA